MFESGFYVSSLQSSDNIEIQLLSKSEITSSTSCMALPIFARYYKTGKLLLQGYSDITMKNKLIYDPFFPKNIIMKNIYGRLIYQLLSYSQVPELFRKHFS